MSQKILMLTSTWDVNYTKGLVDGVKRRTQDKDIDVHIFNVYDEVEESNFYEKEREIFLLPNISEYDAAIFALTSTDAIDALKRVMCEYKAKGKVIVSVDTRIDGIPFIGIDNYHSMYKMVEHLIDVHGCKTFNFVGGQVDNLENIQRYNAFCDCLKAHNLEVESERVKFYSFLRKDGETAFYDFMKENKHTPDAVVSASDNMAIGYCEAARKEGYSAPDDFKIVGFDNLTAGQRFIPAMSTIDRHWEQLGYDTADYVLELMEGKTSDIERYTEGSVCIRESCGCNRNVRDMRDDYSDLLREYKESGRRTIRLSFARKKLCASFDLNRLMQNMHECEQMIGIRAGAVVISDLFFNGDYEKPKIGFTDGAHSYTSSGQEEFTCCGKLIPDIIYNRDENVYLFAPLHIGNQTFGYYVMPFDGDMFSNNIHRMYIENLSLALSGICQRVSLDDMNANLKELYVRDSLTGLYNRFGYASRSKEFYLQNKGRIYMVYMDLDNLKMLNDTYGHDMGDTAIKGGAEALKHIFTDTDIHVRMGGDEYLVIGRFISDEYLIDCERRVNDYLLKYGMEHNLPVPLEASIGHVYNDSDVEGCALEELVHLADNKMYEVKQKRKKQRQS